MTWVNDNWGDIFTLARSHVWLAGVPLLLGLLIALPLGWAARRWSRMYPVIISTSGLLYTIPSLALFVLMPIIIPGILIQSTSAAEGHAAHETSVHAIRQSPSSAARPRRV